MRFIIVNCSNHDVADKYTQIVSRAAEHSGYEVVYVNSLTEAFKYSALDIYYVGTVVEGARLFLRGRKKVVVWMQGILPEESYMRNASAIRRSALSFLEKLALKKAVFLMYVSKAMKEHYMEKYHIDTSGHDYIMPCYSDEFALKLQEAETTSRYCSNSYCYVGSLAKWQGFDRVLRIYSKIEKVQSDSKLHVFTKDEESAEKYIREAGILRYEIAYVNRLELSEHLKNIKYGFLIRNRDIVNRVSTPTKMSTYISSGVIPICTEEVEFFKELLAYTKYKVIVGENDSAAADLILSRADDPVDAMAVYREYAELYERFYDSDKHVNRLAQSLKLLKTGEIFV